MPDYSQFIPNFRCLNKVLKLILECNVKLGLAQRLGMLKLGVHLRIQCGCLNGCILCHQLAPLEL